MCQPGWSGGWLIVLRSGAARPQWRRLLGGDSEALKAVEDQIEGKLELELVVAAREHELVAGGFTYSESPGVFARPSRSAASSADVRSARLWRPPKV